MTGDRLVRICESSRVKFLRSTRRSLLVLDTRTRRISEQEAELLHAGAKAAVEALEVRAIATEARMEPLL